MRLIQKLIWVNFAVLLFCAGVQARAPDFTIQAQGHGADWLILLTPPPAHHFNVQAPMALLSGGKKFKAKSATEKQIRFEVPKATGSKFKIAVYLCDDAKTFCEKRELDYAVQSQQTSTSEPTVAANSAQGKSPPRSEPQSIYGFILNNPDLALKQAKAENKPLMIDFFGIWCPPCNELDERIFSTKKFARASSRFVRLKLDVDSPISWKLKADYHISGYPTVVFATATGEEISRIVGFRPEAEFFEQMSDAFQSRQLALSKLEAQAAAGDRQAADRAGVIRYNRGESGAAAKLLANSKDKKEFWHLAEIDALENAGASAEQRISRIKQAVSEFPKTPNTIDWYGKLASLYEARKEDDQKRAALQHAIDLSFELAKEPALLKGYDATPADLLESEADYREQLDGKVKAKSDWVAAAKAYAQQGVGETERANNMEIAFCLSKAGDFEKAREIYRRLEKAYPNEFTFFYNHARMEKEASHLQDALAVGMKAYDRSYGDNKLKTTKVVAQLYTDLGEKDRAKAIIDEALKTTELPSDTQVRTHRYAEDLKKFRATLN